MQYTINKVASLAGITTKTLRFYDKIGLLVPHERSDSGYRLYSDGDIATLQQILFYKELGFPLQQIAEILKNPELDMNRALKFQLEVLGDSAKKYNKMMEFVQQTLDTEENGFSPGAKQRPAEKWGNDRTALLICNMQNDFVYGRLGSASIGEVVEHIRELLAAVRKTHGRSRIYVIYLCDSHVRGADRELQIWGDHAIAGTEGAEIVAPLAPGQDDFIIYKKNYGGFFQTNLQTILTKLNIGSLIITGSHLDLCILQTMDEAYKWGYDVYVPADCVNASTPEGYEFGLRQAKTAYAAKVVSLPEMIALVENGLPR